MIGRSILLTAALAAMGLVASGCSFSTFDAPATVSTKNSAAFAQAPLEAPIVSGRSCDRVVLLFIPVGFAEAETAFARALEKAPGSDTLVNWRLEHDVVIAGPFYWQACVTVKGQAVNAARLLARAPDPERGRALVRHWREQRSLAAHSAKDLAPAATGLPDDR